MGHDPELERARRTPRSAQDAIRRTDSHSSRLTPGPMTVLLSSTRGTAAGVTPAAASTPIPPAGVSAGNARGSSDTRSASTGWSEDAGEVHADGLEQHRAAQVANPPAIVVLMRMTASRVEEEHVPPAASHWSAMLEKMLEKMLENQ